MLVTFACMLGLAAVARPLIIILIGEKWLTAVSFLQIICFSGMLYPLHAINLNILQVKGRSDLCLKLEIIKKIIAIGPIVVGIFYGIEYMLWLFSLLDISVYIQLLIQIMVGLTLAFAVYERLKLPEYLEVKRLFLSALHKK